MLIGLTGQIGSGKTTAATIFKKLGAFVIDADLIGREVVEKTYPLLRSLVRTFGPEILDKNGRLKRKKLASIAFATKENRDKLNSLVHPYLLSTLRLRMRRALREKELVVVDAALLLDWGLDKEMDRVLVIHTSLEKRLARLAARGITRRDALARQKAQFPFSEFRRRADRVILNNGSKTDLEKKIRKFLSRNLTQTN
ncbi:MAG: dephospho-CoA kinase [candidate division Zixibacteria bacterium]|nr:dephospho-CoA kinase [candidate division Zixibacteria bacterium]